MKQIFHQLEKKQIQFALNRNGLFGTLFILYSAQPLNQLMRTQAKQHLLQRLLLSHPSLSHTHPALWADLTHQQLTPLASWSHTPSWLGLWVNAGNHSVGLDIEKIDRIRPSVATRISRPDELTLCSPSSVLWPIKEASFKAFNHLYPLKTMSQVRVTSWQPIARRPLPIWRFEAETILDPNQKSAGIIFQKNGHYFCIAQS